jgi:hypothetical protein
VEEYYLYDPESGDLQGWERREGHLEVISAMVGWVSPRLGIRFAYAAEDELILERPDGRRFRSYLELDQEWQQSQRKWEQAQRELEQAQRERERLAAKLRALGIDPDEV